jgi:UDP-glucose 4-epimerase
MNVLDAARRLGLGRIVCASSTTVGYTGFATQAPGPIGEDLALRMLSDRPASIYAATKVAGEQLGLLHHDLYGVDVVMLRYAAVLGRETGAPSSVPGRLLAHLVAAAREGREAVIDDPFMAWDGVEEFVDARDCARANLAALEAASPMQRVYNIAPGQAVTLAEFAACVARVHPGLRVRLPAPDGRGFAGFPHLRPGPSDVTAAAREMGFRCVHDLEATIRDAA